MKNTVLKIRISFLKQEFIFCSVWIEVKGKNKNSSFLIGTFYQPSSENQAKSEWIDKFEIVLSKVFSNWEGLPADTTHHFANQTR